MKRLLTVLIILGVVGGGGYFWFETSVYKVLLTLRDAVQNADLATVEKHADLDKFAENAVDFGAAVAEVGAKDAGGELGASVIKGLTGIFRTGLQAQLKPQIKDEMRATIASGEFPDVLGPFQPKQGYDALADVVSLSDDKKRVLIVGTCEGEPAIAEIDFDRVKQGPFGLMSTWKAVGMEESAVKRLAAVCYEGARKTRGK